MNARIPISLGLIFISFLSACRKDCDPNPDNTSDRGCGDFIVYSDIQISGYPNSYIVLQVDKPSLSLSGQARSFDLANHPYLFSNLESFNGPSLPYCNDVLIPGFEMTHTWEAISGKADIWIVRDKNDCERGYVVSAKLTNVTYQDSTGNQILVEEKFFENVLVGYHYP